MRSEWHQSCSCEPCPDEEEALCGGLWTRTASAFSENYYWLGRGCQEGNETNSSGVELGTCQQDT